MTNPAYFNFQKAALPEVVMEPPRTLANGDQHTDYTVGGWSMSGDFDEDGDIEYVRNAVLAWMAWYRFLEQQS